jgi:hypothetical protein
MLEIMVAKNNIAKSHANIGAQTKLMMIDRQLRCVKG